MEYKLRESPLPGGAPAVAACLRIVGACVVVTALLLLAGCGDAARDCTPQNNCFELANGDRNCHPGFTWADPNDTSNYQCVPISDGGSAGGGGDAGSESDAPGIDVKDRRQVLRKRPFHCGDGKCEPPWETKGNCAVDCGASRASVCGDGSCDQGESCGNCSKDCGPCLKDTFGGTCGDGSCDDGESCQSCPKDCGPCGGKDAYSAPDCGPYDIYCYDGGSSSSSSGGSNNGSCAGQCGKYDSGWTCQCDSACEQYGDCCPDKKALCG